MLQIFWKNLLEYANRIPCRVKKKEEKRCSVEGYLTMTGPAETDATRRPGANISSSKYALRENYTLVGWNNASKAGTE